MLSSLLRLSGHVVFGDGSDNFLSVAALVLADHQELIRYRGNRLPALDVDFDPACAIVVGARPSKESQARAEWERAKASGSAAGQGRKASAGQPRTYLRGHVGPWL
jgi:hypothetical protein